MRQRCRYQRLPNRNSIICAGYVRLLQKNTYVDTYIDCYKLTNKLILLSIDLYLAVYFDFCYSSLRFEL